MFDKPCTRFYLIQSVFYHWVKKKNVFSYLFLGIPHGPKEEKKREKDLLKFIVMSSGNCLDNADDALCLNVQTPVNKGPSAFRGARDRAGESVARSSWGLCYPGHLRR